MAPRMKHVGDTNDNPSKAVHTVTVGEKPPADKEVMGPQPREIVSGAGQGQGPVSAGQPVPQGPSSGPVSGVAEGTVTSADPDVVALDAAVREVAALRSSLGTHLHGAPGAGPRMTLPWDGIVRVMDLIAQLLRIRPTLSASVQPAELETASARVRSSKALEAGLEALLADVKDNTKVYLGDGWLQARDVYHTANRLAPRDNTIALAIVPVQALFQRTPKVVKAPMAAADQTRRATNAATRASKAATKATAAQQRAARLAPPTPEPSGVDQGPAHSTTAGTPATPGTPGTSQTR